jgi:transposase InsO family protein
LATCKWHSGKHRSGKVNEHNAWIPREHWLEAEERQALLDFQERFPLEGYRRLTFRMIDAASAACSPSSVYRVLKEAGRLDRHPPKPSSKGKGFVQPLRPHEHRHVDGSYLNSAGTFYYLCSLLDGCSRFTAHWEIREALTEADVERIIQRARERFPGVTPRIISDTQAFFRRWYQGLSGRGMDADLRSRDG